MPGSYDNLKYKGGDAAEMDAQMMYAKIQSLEKKVQNHEKDKAEQLEDLMHHDFVDHDDHRIHYQSEGYIEVERDDPWLPMFSAVDWIQEMAVPLVLGAVAAMIFANTIEDDYAYYFGGKNCCGTDTAHRMLGAAPASASGSYNCAAFGGDAEAAHRMLGGDADAYAEAAVFANYCVKCCVEAAHRMLGAAAPTPSEGNCGAEDHEVAHRMLGGASAIVFSHGCDRYLFSNCMLFGHPVTFQFVVNNMFMCGHFALAMKEITEAALPGGSLNPPSKAVNPLISSIGGILGPILSFFILLNIFWATGMFDDDVANYDVTFAELRSGWGIVTSSDIVLAWLIGRVVFGDGHPAIDYLLLLAVADDFFGILIIAFFYQDPTQKFHPEYLLLIVAGMFTSYLMRKWHFRKEHTHHQAWQPYIIIGGSLSWAGFIHAGLHPALALVPIVPFMPGPNSEALSHLDKQLEHEMMDEATDGHTDELTAAATGVTHHNHHLGMDHQHHLDEQGDAEHPEVAVDHAVIDHSVPNIGDMIKEHREFARGRGTSIQAGLYAGLAGHGVDDALKVIEYDEGGNEVLHTSTLDEFEHFLKFWVDMGLVFFSLVNAGVTIGPSGIGSNALLIFLSLFLGKAFGVVSFYKLACHMGFPAPLGVRAHHMRMIGLMSSLALTFALFVSDVAYTNEKIKGDAKIGALLTSASAGICYAFSMVQNFKDEDIQTQAKIQLAEELEDAVKHVDHGAQTNPNYQNKHTVDHHIKHLQGLEEGKKQPNPLQPDPQAAAAAEPQEAARTTRVTTAETYEALLAANEALSAAQAQMNAAHEQEAARRTTRVTTTETYDALMAANEAHSVAEEVASAESGVADAPSDVQLAPAPEVVLTAIPEVAADGAHESQQAEEVSTAAAPAPMLAPTHGHQKGEHTRTNKHNEAAHKEPAQVPTLSGTPRSKRSTTH